MINDNRLEQKTPRLIENSIVTLPVARKASFGVFLSSGTGNSSDDILLHQNQQTKPLNVGDEVKVFLYHDPRGRLTASMHLPEIGIGEIGYASVMLTTRFGAFVDLGTERGIFLPFSEMIDGHVQKGQKIWIRLYVDKTGRLAVTMHVDKEMEKLARPAEGIRIGGKVEGSIYNKTPKGIFLITRDRWIAFAYQPEVPDGLHMGDMVAGRVTFIRPDGHLDISLRPQKEYALTSDSETLLRFMENHNGALFYNDRSDPADIKMQFHMSKAAFKRAVGHLFKTDKILLKDGSFYLK